MIAKYIFQKISISKPEYLGQGPLVSNSLFGIHVKSNILSQLPQTDYGLTSALTPDGGLINGVGALSQGQYQGRSTFTSD